MNDKQPITNDAAIAYEPRLCAGTNLISMTKFVLDKKFGYGNEFITSQQFCDDVIKYVNFLRKPITLSMFVPCDEDDIPLEIADFQNFLGYIFDDYGHAKYISARNKVLFPGFEIVKYFDAAPGEITKTIKYKNCYAAHFLDDKWNLGVGLKVVEDLVSDDLCVNWDACT